MALLGGTDINYVMQDSPMDAKERPQNIVTFVSFREMDSQGQEETSQAIRIGGMDVLVNVDINNDVQAAVDLSADGNNQIDLKGGGNLTYTMNPLGDVRLSGKYVLSGGSVRYNPPIISQKIFKITPDSYVEWIGNIADPAFNITAVETVRANVSSDGQDNRAVNFDISINIRNSLDDLEISFGLSAPEDLTMQNQLNSLTAEQRANQAMNLLIYNTYTGPGTTAKVSSENPLNSFIQKELNQWAQNNLKGVDLSFGINSYGEDDPNGQRTDYSYRLSKNLFSNRVRAVIGGKFSTDADPSQNLKENLIDDISLEYMLTKRDNMYLKVFRHTGYESILEGEITETGVGFVIRKKLLDAFGGNVDIFIVGGAPMNQETESFLMKIKFPITIGYGMTECAPLISFTPDNEFKAGSCGRYLKGLLDVRIDSPDPEHVAGEIVVRGEHVMKGYYKNEKDTEKVLEPDGWLHTGDMGTMDPDGTLYIRGRSKTMILSGSGQNIYPEEIEDKLNNMYLVLESLILDSGNGKLKAMVVPDYEQAEAEGVDKNDLPQIMQNNLTELNSLLAAYERVSEIIIYPTEFEKTPKRSIKRYLYSPSLLNK